VIIPEFAVLAMFTPSTLGAGCGRWHGWTDLSSVNKAIAPLNSYGIHFVSEAFSFIQRWAEVNLEVADHYKLHGARLFSATVFPSIRKCQCGYTGFQGEQVFIRATLPEFAVLAMCTPSSLIAGCGGWHGWTLTKLSLL